MNQQNSLVIEFYAPQFQSPSQNIDYGMGSLGNKAFASREVADHTWVPPPRPSGARATGADRFELRQGTAPGLVCNSDTLRGSDLPTLTYGSTGRVNPLTCARAATSSDQYDPGESRLTMRRG